MKTYFILQSMSTSKDINFLYTNAEINRTPKAIKQMIFNNISSSSIARAKMQLLFEIVGK